MTSQQYDDGWDNWGEDSWANSPEGNNNNNARPQSSQVIFSEFFLFIQYTFSFTTFRPINILIHNN